MIASQHLQDDDDEDVDEDDQHKKHKSKQRQLITPMTDKQLKDNLFLLFVAGHETSASALSWALYELSRNPDIQQRAREEVDRVLNERPPTSPPLPQHLFSFDDLAKMEYLHAILRETLRLWNPAPFIIRNVQFEPTQNNNNQPRTLKVGEYLIPENTNIIIGIHAIHHDPAHWPDPYRFNPDRFLQNEKGAAASTRHPFAWLPFSAGPRGCIGSKFSLLEMKITLALILKNFDVVADPLYKLSFARDITMHPQNLSLIFRPRT
jgi:cytochrome P450